MDTTTIANDTIVKVIQVTANVTNPESANNICCNYSLVLLIILLSGIVGGVINYLSFEQPLKDDNKSPSFYHDKSFYLQLLLGICGAGLIPLFLYLTSSKLFEKCDDCFFVYFVFSGYCLIGAVFSRALLKSIAKRLDLEKFQEDLNRQKKELEKVKGGVNEAEKFIESKLEEEEQEAEEKPKPTIETKSSTIKENIDMTDNILHTDINSYIIEKADHEMEVILNDLQKSKFRDRSIQGVSKTSKIHENNVTVILRAFMRAGIVDEVRWYGKTFYRLTTKGKEVKLIK